MRRSMGANRMSSTGMPTQKEEDGEDHDGHLRQLATGVEQLAEAQSEARRVINSAAMSERRRRPSPA